MLPDAPSIARARYVAQLVVRLFAAACVVYFAYRLTMLGIGTLGLGMNSSIRAIVFEVLRAGTWLVPAALLVLFQRRLIAWLLPTPSRSTCPACGYRLFGLERPKCPECGLNLTEAQMRAANEAGPVRGSGSESGQAPLRRKG